MSAKTAWGATPRVPAASFATAMLTDLEEQKLKKQQADDFRLAKNLQEAFLPPADEQILIPEHEEIDHDLLLAQQLQAQFDQELRLAAAPQPAASSSSSSSSSKAGGEIGLDEDQLLALKLQAEFDRDFNRSISAREKQTNFNSKVQISYDKYRLTEYPAVEEELGDDSYEDLDVPSEKLRPQGTNQQPGRKNRKGKPTPGHNGRPEIVTKHDITANALDNARRMETLNSIPVGNVSQVENLRLPYKVFNNLKNMSGKSGKQSRNKTRLFDEEDFATQESVLDKRTKLILLQMINQGILEHVEGIISTGKEASVYYGMAYDDWEDEESDDAPKKKKKKQSKAEREEAEDEENEDEDEDEDEDVEDEFDDYKTAECVIKIFKTTLQEFKNREEYIRDDSRFVSRLSRHNSRKLIKLWAEKEALNLGRMHRAGIPCPEVLHNEQHLLVLTLIGKDKKAAPKLKDVGKFLSSSTREDIYGQCIRGMRDLYQKAGLVHADLSEYNLLYHEHKLWFIDVSQAVERSHPNANLFLFRDCCNVTRFFQSIGVSSAMTELELFSYVTSHLLSMEDEENLTEQIREWISQKVGERKNISIRDPSIHEVLDALIPSYADNEIFRQLTEDGSEEEDGSPASDEEQN